jgi:hypothetical protein
MGTIGGIKIVHTPQQGKTLHEHNQIKLKFPNGYSASVIYGALAYSTNERGERIAAPLGDMEYAATVEIAIYDPQNEPVPFKDGTEVKGFVPITELFQILNWVSTR